MTARPGRIDRHGRRQHTLCQRCGRRRKVGDRLGWHICWLYETLNNYQNGRTWQ